MLQSVVLNFFLQSNWTCRNRRSKSARVVLKVWHPLLLFFCPTSHLELIFQFPLPPYSLKQAAQLSYFAPTVLSGQQQRFKSVEKGLRLALRSWGWHILCSIKCNKQQQRWMQLNKMDDERDFVSNRTRNWKCTFGPSFSETICGREKLNALCLDLERILPRSVEWK